MVSRTHRSVVARDAAQKSIDNKLMILKAWAENGIPTSRDSDGRELLDHHDLKVLEFFPTSVRQFKLWDGSQNSPSIAESLPKFTSTGNDTLSKRPQCVELVVKALAAIGARAEAQRLSGRPARLRELEARVRVLESTLKTRITEIREQQRSVRQLVLERDSLSTKLDCERHEFERVFSSLSEQLHLEKARCAELTAALSKVAPLVSARTPSIGS